MVLLVSVLQTAQNCERLLWTGFDDAHGLESTFQSRILFDVFPVLVNRRRPDALQLASCERGLHQVTGIHTTIFSGATGANEHVNLIDE